MALVTETITKTNGIQEVYVYQEGNPDQKHLAYVVDRKNMLVTFQPRRSSLKIKNITLEGFDRLPPEFHEKGFIKSGAEYYLGKKFVDKQVSSLVISKTGKNSVRKSKSGYRIRFNYNSFRQLRNVLSRLNFESTRDRSIWVDEYFHDLFPRHFKKPAGLSTSERTRRLVSQLDESLIDHLKTNEAEILVDFFEKLLRKRGMSSVRKRRLFESAKLKVDDITIVEIVKQFEAMLSNGRSEQKWGEYLRRNLFLIDARYVNSIPQLNVQLGGTRKMDFGLIDSQGYLDIFEIKLPTTPLLAKNPDRGNYYWSTDAVKALVQAEKYLYNAEQKGADLARDIKREKGLTTDVIRPRALLLIGQNSQLDNDNKKEDFRVLRRSLKNVEVILYDELLERLRLQKGKTYIG